MDETGQPGAEATAGGNDGGDREGAYEHQSWSSSDSRESSFDAQDGGRRSPTTGRSAVGSARVNGDNTSIRARSDLRPSQHEQLAPVTPLNAWERRGRIPNGAEPPADQVNGARPLTLAEHSAMMDNLPYADRRSTSDGPAGQSPSGYFSARPVSPAGGTPSGEYPRSGPAGGEPTPPLLVSAPTRPDRPLPGQPPADRPGHSGYASPAGPVSSPAGPFPPLTTDRRTGPPATPTAPGVDPATSRGLPTAPRSAPPFPGLSPTTGTSIGSAAVPPTTTSIGSAAVAPTSIGSAAVPPVAPLPPPLPASGPTSGPPLRPVSPASAGPAGAPPLPEPAAPALPEPAAPALPEEPVPSTRHEPTPTAADFAPRSGVADFGSSEKTGYRAQSFAELPAYADRARADAGRHSDPGSTNADDGARSGPVDGDGAGFGPTNGDGARPGFGTGERARPAFGADGARSGGRHAGTDTAEESPWAPPPPPPGYERIPTARTAPRPQYDELPAYQDQPPPSPSRPYVRAAERSKGELPPRGSSPGRGEAVPENRGTAEPAGRRSAHDQEPEHRRPGESGWPDQARPLAAAPPVQPNWPDPLHEPPPWDRLVAAARIHDVLPQRVPAEPDVPVVPEAVREPAVDGMPAAAPELARIATYLRDEEEDEPSERPDVFDIPAVLAAVRVFPGVREAQVRTNPTGAHTLRLELADDADPGEVSRDIARLLKERMGLAAEPNDDLLTHEDLMGGPAAPVVPGRRRAAEPDGSWSGPAEPRAADQRTPDQRTPDQRTPEPAPVRDSDPRLRNTGPHPRDLAEAGQSGLPVQPTPHDRGATTGNPVVGNAAPTRRAEALPRTAASAADPRTDEPRAGGPRTAEPRQRPIEPTWAAPTRALAQPFEQNRDTVPAHRPLPGVPGVPRVVLDEVEVSTQGTDAVVEVRLSAEHLSAVGMASGPDFDGYVLRLAAVAAANAVDDLVAGAARCFVENATVVPLGSCEVAVVVLLLAHGGWVEELSGSAVVNGDQRQAVVRATLAAVNRRLEALLP